VVRGGGAAILAEQVPPPCSHSGRWLDIRLRAILRLAIGISIAGPCRWQSGRTNFRGRLGVRPLALHAVKRYSWRSHRHQHFPLPMVRVEAAPVPAIDARPPSLT